MVPCGAGYGAWCGEGGDVKILCIVQARMDSARFPGKVLADLAGQSILTHVVSRCLASGLQTVVATTSREVDDPINLRADSLLTPQGALRWGSPVSLFAWDGPVDDVLGRYIACAETYRADAIIRVTGDSPLVLVEAIKVAAEQLQSHAGGVVAITREFGMVPDGWEVEGCSVEYLSYLDSDNPSFSEREHVFPGIYTRLRAQIRQALPTPRPSKWNEPWLMKQRFSVDTPEDLEWLRSLAEHLDLTPPRPDPGEIYDLLQQKPEVCR